MKTLALITLFAFFSGNFSGVISNEEWKLVRQTEDFSVFTRKLEGNDLKELKIIGTVETSMLDLVRTLEAVNSHTDWVYRLIESRKIRDISEHSFDYVVVVDMPFPLKDRFGTLRYERMDDINSDEVVIVTSSIQPATNYSEGYVSISDYHSKYILRKQENGQIHLAYTLRIDPGGKLPDWAINLATVKGPFKTMQALVDKMKP